MFDRKAYMRDYQRNIRKKRAAEKKCLQCGHKLKKEKLPKLPIPQDILEYLRSRYGGQHKLYLSMRYWTHATAVQIESIRKIMKVDMPLTSEQIDNKIQTWREEANQ